jgi:alanine racemase
MRPARISLDVAAARHNLKHAKALNNHQPVWAVIKADGYGHGLLWAANAFCDANGFAVASVEEAIALREGGFDLPILLLEGLFSANEAELADALNLQLVVHDPVQIDWLAAFAPEAPWKLWVKVDTGMHRLGISLAACAGIITRIRQQLPSAQPNLLSHFACADSDGAFTAEQLQRFRSCHDTVKNEICEVSLANSAALISVPDARVGWARPGIMLYGATPLDSQLRPVMHFCSALIAIKRISRGEGVGYDLTWRAQRDSTIGIVAAGYGDGYPRHARNGTPVWVEGARVPLIGRVSMDMLCVDLTDHPRRHQLHIGSPVELWGENVPVWDVAEQADTIAYELVCGITARVKREQTR